MEIDLFVMVALTRDQPRLFRVVPLKEHPGLYNAEDIETGARLVKNPSESNRPDGVTITYLMHVATEVFDQHQVDGE